MGLSLNCRVVGPLFGRHVVVARLRGWRPLHFVGDQILNDSNTVLSRWSWFKRRQMRRFMDVIRRAWPKVTRAASIRSVNPKMQQILLTCC